MSGKAAAFGGRMMGSVADQVLKQFAANFAAQRCRRMPRAAGEPPAQARRRPRRPPAAPAAERSSTAWPCWAVIKDWLRSLFAAKSASMSAERALELAGLQQELARRRLHRRAQPRGGAAADAATWAGRCCSKATPAWARPRSPRCWPTVRGTRLIRLQCYEGLDAHAAMYEWNYQRQLLAIKLLEHDERAVEGSGAEGAGHLLRALPAQAPAARGDQLRAAAGAADRRGRPRRRSLRGLPARAAVGLPALDPRTRHRARDQPAAGGDHLQRHARAVGRVAPALPVPVHRLPRLREGARHRAQEGAARRRPRWRSRSSPSCRACAAWSCRRNPASPRRWTGPPRCCGWASRRIDIDGAERIMETLSALIKTRDDRAAFPREVVARLAAAC